MNFEDLTPKQQEVVLATERVVLTLGGAGTGKTTTALWAARRFLSERASARRQRVLFLTFSRTAVAQILLRSHAVLDDVGLVEISTFHGVAFRLLQAFGRYGGRGLQRLALQSAAEEKLFGKDESKSTYKELIPAALELLKSNRLSRLLADRWPLVVCDEFQDTSNEQWKLVASLGRTARLLLLADTKQMIYTFVPGVGLARIAEAKKMADRIVELPSQSHRDPSGVIPASAESIMNRSFATEAVEEAVRSQRIVVRSFAEDAFVPAVLREIGDLWASGCKSIGVFLKTNESVAELAASLAVEGINHVLVGIAEAHGEALRALSGLCEFAVGRITREMYRRQLAVFLTSCTRAARGKAAPELALALIGQGVLPSTLEQRLTSLEEALRSAAVDSPAALIDVVCDAWRGLGIRGGSRPWRRAANMFWVLARSIAARSGASGEVFVEAIAQEVQRAHSDSLIDLHVQEHAPVRLMNFHQTKGRETDGVVLAFRSDDYFGREGEPFVEGSRLLYVSITRARQRVRILLPPAPHALVAPLARLATE